MVQKTYLIKEVDRSILLALARFHYLTAAQANRLLYPNNSDENRYAQRLLKRLADAGYLLKLRALERPRKGQLAHVYTLADKGRKYVKALGVSVEPYFRPSEEKRSTWNSPFMKHTLAAIDVMIAADSLCREFPQVVCPQMYSERELKRHAVHVEVPPTPRSIGLAARQVAVIPDAWFQLSIDGADPYSIALELDRSTEDQNVWRQKVAAYAVWAKPNGPYQEAFEADTLAIAVVCLDERRRLQLIDWTMRELTARNITGYADLFLFTATSPISVEPKQFFFGNIWREADNRKPVALLDIPPPVQQESGVVYQAL